MNDNELHKIHIPEAEADLFSPQDYAVKVPAGATVLITKGTIVIYAEVPPHGIPPHVPDDVIAVFPKKHVKFPEELLAEEDMELDS
jgi:hypothetical protein